MALETSPTRKEATLLIELPKSIKVPHEAMIRVVVDGQRSGEFLVTLTDAQAFFVMAAEMEGPQEKREVRMTCFPGQVAASSSPVDSFMFPVEQHAGIDDSVKFETLPGIRCELGKATRIATVVSEGKNWEVVIEVGSPASQESEKQ
jgi:hypothetical protein